ncbi:MAG: hypothetical protein A3G32_02240 [Deltaproteobacteria bacterium RIFCSPLOWO2_12_FULL_40_28]|nr:MAG: hypothetical protein A3C45_02920 [Deltaproteobacteria bacterium RIFCSPHIGHO2_02_FULL_40_28]OGQ20647.1 MAG: hypothetical protein A3E27_10030 [Deltaproteobacteria bacterium RIFCSPHIGHO2_12_FULL_40_32]OGQ38882.1 MAG: hypothetical protein A3I69_08250 [Deltaproteobacteria bacterium RIFCSPLOWO2_02_FULL_40_36]OGQ55241.1 MAG: hypothetical protein A3G32_02240 [Deltaproteobacteria bacterium RIFCSPLOWO2_12_FULL_40_28]
MAHAKLVNERQNKVRSMDKSFCFISAPYFQPNCVVLLKPTKQGLCHVTSCGLVSMFVLDTGQKSVSKVVSKR